MTNTIIKDYSTKYGDTISRICLFGAKNFNLVINLNHLTFTERVYFNFAKFEKHCNFNNSIFKNDLDFENSIFKDDVDFESSIFNGVVFTKATVCKRLFFSNVVFKNSCLFNSLNLSDSSDLIFLNTEFPDTIDFSNNFNIPHDIDFSKGNFDRIDNFRESKKKKSLIYLYKTDISKLHLDYIHFSLLLPDSTISYYNEKKMALTSDDKESMYEALLSNFKTRGQNQSYKICDVEYHTYKWKRHWLSSIFVWLPKYWWNWGYNKEYIFYWIIAFVLFFSLTTSFFLSKLNPDVCHISNIPLDAHKKKYPRRLWYSFMYTCIIFFSFTLKLDNIKFDKILSSIYIIMIYVIGLVCLGYLANYILQK